MLQRHKIPTIFNIYMLDVICCALGCVVLLWQVAHQEAEQQTADAKESHAEALKQADAAIRARLQYEKAQQDLLSASSDVMQLQADVTAWKQKHQQLTQALAATQKDRDKTQGALNVSTDQRKKLETDLAKLLAEQKKTSADLAGANKSNADLLAKISSADKKAKDQAAAVALSEETARKLQKLLDTIAVDSKDAQAKLKLADLQLKMREQDLERARVELAELAASKNKLAKSVSGGAKDLTEAKGQVAALTAERDQLKDKLVGVNRKLDSLKADAEQRFAGVPLTGESVVFLIDISGSMTMKDENTEDPEKWPFLCDTLMKLMQSIPTMQRFQVILFSDKTRYLFGSRDSWLKYEGHATAKLTRDALRKVKVEGGTNMEEGFEEAFRFRKLKLDTIYLFSDGLPNIGSGVPASIRNPTEEQRNSFMGKFVRDKLKTDWNRPQEGMNDVRINAVGFFFESPDVGAFLWAMAREHRGAFVGLR